MHSGLKQTVDLGLSFISGPHRRIVRRLCLAQPRLELLQRSLPAKVVYLLVGEFRDAGLGAMEVKPWVPGPCLDELVLLLRGEGAVHDAEDMAPWYLTKRDLGTPIA